MCHIFSCFNFSSNILFIIPYQLTSFKFLAIILFEIRHLQNFVPLFVKGEIIQGKPEICVGYFSMRNPYMKFLDDISNMNTQIHTLPPTPNWSPYIVYVSSKSKSRSLKIHASIIKPRLCQDSASYFIQK